MAGDTAAPQATRDEVIKAIEDELKRRQAAGEAPQQPAQPQPAEDNPLLPDGAAGMIDPSKLQGAAPGLLRAARGGIGAMKESADFLTGIADWGDKQLGTTFQWHTDSPTAAKVLHYVGRPLDLFSDAFGAAHDAISPPKDIASSLIEGVTQFSVGMIGMGKLARLAGIKPAVSTAGKVVRSLAKGAAVDMTVFDGQDGKLADLADQWPPVQGPLVDFLKTKPDDTQAEGRLKQALNGLIVGPLLEAFVWSVKAVRFKNAGMAKEAVQATEEANKALEQAKAHDNLPPDMLPGDNAEAPKPADPAIPPAADAPPAPDAPPVEPTQPDLPLEFTQDPNNIRNDVSSDGKTIDPNKASGTAPPGEQPKPVANSMPKLSDEDVKGVNDAIRSRFTVGGEDMTLTGQDFNFDRLNGPEDVKATINAMSATIEDVINKAKGGNADGVRTWQNVQRNADRLIEMAGADPEQFMAMVAKDAKSMQHIDARLHAYKIMLQSVVDDAANKASMALAATGPDAAKMAAASMHSTRVAVQLLAMVKSIETNVARAQGAQRILKAFNPENTKGWDYTNLAKELSDNGISDADKVLLQRIASFKGNPKGLRKFVEGGSVVRKAADVVNEYYVNALLSGFKTHIVNFISNTGNLVYQPIERAIAGALPGGVGVRESARTALDEFYGMKLALLDTFKLAGKALYDGHGVLDPSQAKVDLGSGHAIDARNFGLTKDIYDMKGDIVRTETTPVLSEMVNGVGTIVNLPSRLLVGQDEIFKQLAYRSYLFAKYAKEARLQGLAKPEEIADWAAQRMLKDFDANGVAKDKIGLQRAREVTFTQDLEYGFGKWLQEGSSKFPPMRLVVPFVRTPTNIFRWTWQHTPGIGMLQRQMMDDIRAGGDRARLATAKQITGAAFYTIALGGVMSGMITGGGPSDPDQRRALEATGWKPYSIRINGKYYSYDRGDPFFMPFGLVADLNEIAGHLKDGDVSQLAGGMTLAMAKNMSNKTYMQGITNVINAYGDAVSGRSTTGLDSWAYRTVGAFVPSAVAQFKDDPDLHEVRSVMDAFRARLPWTSQSVPPVRNILGEKVQAPSFLGPDIVSPIGYSEDKHDVVADELARLMGKEDKGLHRQWPRLDGTTIDLRDFKLHTGQNAYDRIQELAGTIKGPGGKTLRQTLRALFESDIYKNKMTDGDSTVSGSRMDAVQRIIQAYRSTSRAQLLKENPELVDLLKKEIQRNGLTKVAGPQPKNIEPPGFLSSVLGN